MFSQCPKCGHAPLPADQALPAACPGCGAILAKLGAPLPRTRPAPAGPHPAGSKTAPLWLHVPAQVDPLRWWLRAALLAAFTVWGWHLIAMDYRDGSLMHSFLHRPLLIFHEAGHVVFMPLGEWMSVAGGTLGQLLMPAIMAGALLYRNRDPFGAAIGLWLLGVSVLDVAPYVYDAWEPRLTLLGGGTGETGPHDWMYLLGSMGLVSKAQFLGALVHKLGAIVVLVALGWGVWVLKRQRARLSDAPLVDD